MADLRIPCVNCGVKHLHLTADQCADRKMTEATLQARVVYRAKKYGWKIAPAGKGVTEGGWVTQMSPGWPDLTLAKAGHSLLFFELKRELGEESPEQRAWLDLLNLCGAQACIVRLSNLRGGFVEGRLSQPAEFRPAKGGLWPPEDPWPL